MSPPTWQGSDGAEEAPAEEAELLARLRLGDRAAFASLVTRHGGALLRLARAYTRDRAMAEELVQDAWVAALDGLDGFEGRSSLKTWLLRILANRARTRLVREGRSLPFSALEARHGDDGPEGGGERFDERGAWRAPPEGWVEEDPERLLQGAQARAAIERAIAALPEAQRVVITLRDVEGLETEEICRLLGVSAGNCRVLLHRARARVREAIEAAQAGPGR